MINRSNILSGPKTHVCWTPDQVPKEQRIKVVLISEKDFNDLLKTQEEYKKLKNEIRKLENWV